MAKGIGEKIIEQSVLTIFREIARDVGKKIRDRMNPDKTAKVTKVVQAEREQGPVKKYDQDDLPETKE